MCLFKKLSFKMFLKLLRKLILEPKLRSWSGERKARLLYTPPYGEGNSQAMESKHILMLLTACGKWVLWPLEQAGLSCTPSCRVVPHTQSTWRTSVAQRGTKPLYEAEGQSAGGTTAVFAARQLLQPPASLAGQNEREKTHSCPISYISLNCFLL